MRTLGRIVLVVLVALVAGGAWLAAELTAPYRGYGPSGVFVEIPHGASKRTIARLLSDQGVVRNRFVFEILCRWRHRQRLEAGDYLFHQPMTPGEVFDTLAQGRVYVQTITVPEGWTMFDIANLLDREGLCPRDDFLRAAADPTTILDLAPHARNVEGFLFPATYEFPHHVAAQDVIAAMTKRFRGVWNGLPQLGANPHNLSVLRIVTLASLIERETPRPEERPIIADIFYNRLRRGYPLECDPTVIYALELAGQYDGTLRPADLHFDSPYNTYRHYGLPPGPIANPGQASLLAALFPERVDYLYFVADAQGGHLFSKTLAEHDRNVVRYRHLLNGGAPEPPPPPVARMDRPHSSHARPRRHSKRHFRRHSRSHP